ncbi:hypothetical protein ACFQHO_19900 [Actinomadura yumaensis]|uniref:hypothetical protein n=1 Tax=Actinomadura yumaensis TaxID=111807 RepID=UPI0036243E24
MVAATASSEASVKIAKPASSSRRRLPAVAERPGGDQQPGQHERVRVDDPELLDRGRPEVGHQRRERHVEDRRVHRDDQQAARQHREHGPPPTAHASPPNPGAIVIVPGPAAA